jgi:DNA polymerase III subunit epsilon
MRREIVLDTETTGLDARGADRVIEIACVELVNQFRTGKHYHCHIDPERDVPAEAFNVHGLSTEFLKGKPKFSDVAADFVEFIGDATLVIHNAAFDIGFLNAELVRAGHSLLSMDRVVDTLMLARRKHPGGPNSLDALCKRYAIDTSARVKHGALVDCELLSAVYLELSGGHQTKMDLSTATEQQRQRGSRRKPLPARPRPLPPRLTAAEITAHRKFLTTLKDSSWLGLQMDSDPSLPEDEDVSELLEETAD